MNLDQEKARLEHLLDFYYYLENHMQLAKQMFPKLHEETFIRRMCQENSINIQDLNQLLEFLCEITLDSPGIHKY